MAGLNVVDIKLDNRWQLTAAANGDLPLVSNYDCILQDIQIEAMTQEGELFYDQTWGWSMLDFIQPQDDELVRIEIDQRVKQKLSKRIEVNSDTIKTDISFLDGVIAISSRFKFIGDSNEQTVSLSLDRINVEVIEND